MAAAAALGEIGPMVGGKTLLAIDWDDAELRVLEGAISRKTLRLRRAFATAFPPAIWDEGPEAVGRFIRQALRDNGAGSKTVICAVPRYMAVVKDVQLPSLPADEVAGAVHFQSVKSLSFPVDEAVLDHVVTTEQEGKATGALVAVARQEVVSQFQTIFESAGLKLLRLGLRPFATLAAFTHAVDVNPDQVVMVIDVGPKAAEVNIVRGRQLLFSRVVALTGHAYRASAETGTLERVAEKDDSALAQQNVLNEIQRTIHAYRAQDDSAPIECVYITNGSGKRAELLDQLAGQLRLPLEAFDATADAPAARGFEPPAGMSLAANVGLLLAESQPGKAPIDFLHPKKPVVKTDPRKPMAAAVAVLLVLAAVFGMRAFKSKLAASRAALDQFKTERDKLKAQHRDLMLTDKRITLAMARVRNSAVWIDHLQELTDLFPGNRDAVCKRLTFRANRFPTIKKFRKYLTETKKKTKKRKKGKKSKRAAGPDAWLFPWDHKTPDGPVGRIDLKGVARERNVVDDLRETLNATRTYRPAPRAVVPMTGASGRLYPYSFELSIDLYAPPPVKAPASKRAPATQPAGRPKADATAAAAARREGDS